MLTHYSLVYVVVSGLHTDQVNLLILISINEMACPYFHPSKSLHYSVLAIIPDLGVVKYVLVLRLQILVGLLTSPHMKSWNVSISLVSTPSDHKIQITDCCSSLVHFRNRAII
jgi:hypothetical protein